MIFRAVTATPTISTSAYATGDLIGTLMTLNPAEGPRDLCVRGVALYDKDAELADIDIILFDSNPSGTTFTDNAALDIADADLTKIVAVVSVVSADYSSFADNAVATFETNIPFRSAESTTKYVYACLVARSAPTYTAASDLSLRLLVSEE